MRTLCLLLILTLSISCENRTHKDANMIKMVPDHASLIVKTTSIEGLKSAFKNNSLLEQFSNHAIGDLKQKLDFLNYIKPSNELLLIFAKAPTDSLQIAVITKYHDSLFNLDSVPNRSVETITAKGLSLTKTTIEDQTIYSVIKDSLFFASNDKVLTEAAFRKTKANASLQELYQASSADKDLSVIINTSEKPVQPNIFIEDTLQHIPFSKYFVLDVDLTQDQLKFDGITIARDSSKSLINVFKNTFPQDNQLAKICPPDSDGFLSLTFNNFKIFQNNLKQFTKQDSIIENPVFESILEAGVIYKDGQQAAAIHSINMSEMALYLNAHNPIETYRDINIYTYGHPELFKKLLAPFINFEKAALFANLDEFFVFAEDINLLKDIIGSYQNNATLYNTVAFENLMKHLSDASSLFIYGNADNLEKIISTNFKTAPLTVPDGFNASAIQFVYETNFAHVHAMLQKTKKTPSSNSVFEYANLTLDADLLTDPQFVNNHTNSDKDIVVQDTNYNLYLISKEGKVLWKRKLDSKILGRIEQIDTYKNGRLQLAFATAHRVYVLDRTGKDVGTFPLKFRDQITQPLAVFDYDKTRDYRLMVTQNASILLYDKRGKRISGFTYKKAKNDIHTQPQHFRIGKKDYLVFVQGNQLEILNRIGNTRIKVKNDIDFSPNAIALYDNKFTTTTNSGELVQIDENGKITRNNSLNLSKNHAITATNKTLVTLSENILHIRSHKIELDFGDYTPPRLFLVNDKIYISVTDIQAKKIYLFDSQGKSIKNFPVYGNSSIDLDNIDKDENPELVTKGENNSIIIYKLN